MVIKNCGDQRPSPKALLRQASREERGDVRTGGSGLGLAIVKGFASAMQMSVSGRNADEGGAELILTFGNEILIRSIGEKDEV